MVVLMVHLKAAKKADSTAENLVEYMVASTADELDSSTAVWKVGEMVD